MRTSSVMQFLLLGTIWGSSYTFIKVSLDGLTPAQLVLTRIVLGLIALLGFIGLRRIALPRLGSMWAHGAVAAALGMVAPFLLLAYGEQRTSAAMAGVLTAVLPLATMAAATAVLPSERATQRRLIGFLVGFAGVVLIMAPWESDPGLLSGQLAVLGSAISYAAQTVYIRKFLVPHGLPPIALAASQLIMATILQGAITPAMAWQRPELTWQVLGSIAILGVFGTGLGYVLYYRLIADHGATTASGVNYLVPIVGVIVSTSLLGDAVTWNMAVGVLAVMAGLAVAENRLPALHRSQPAAPSSPASDRAVSPAAKAQADG